MKRLLPLLFLIITTSGWAQRIVVSDTTQLSLLTCSPGPAGYEKFGHSAIRIYDPVQGIDLSANWGLFDFDQTGFYYKFVRGETYYALGIYSTSAFLESYRERNSSVTEQVLNLTVREKRDLVEKIMVNNLPENRVYLYNFIFDNCATRPHEMIMELFPGRSINNEGAMINKSFREWVAEYSGERSWMMFGIDLVFGKDADRIATAQQSLFLPEVLEDHMDGMRVHSGDGDFRKLISEKSLLVRKDESKVKRSFENYYGPVVITLLLLFFGVYILWLEFKKGRRKRVFDFALHLILGLVGIIITYLMFFSIHPLVGKNLNLLWANPLSIATAIISMKPGKRKSLIVLHLTHLTLVLLAFLLFAMGVQMINIAFLPLMILLLARSVYYLQRHLRLQPKDEERISLRKKGVFR